MIGKINGVLEDAKPIFITVALIFGVLATWSAVADLVPILKQVWSPSGTAQEYAIVSAALAITAGKA